MGGQSSSRDGKRNQNHRKKRKYGCQSSQRDRRSDNDRLDGSVSSTVGMAMSRRRYLLQNPRRGGPGILMTCETGREFKCQREGLEIIHHYFEKYCSRNPMEDRKGSCTTQGEEDIKSDEPLSLEEELKQLQAQQGKNTPVDTTQNFGIFETGCRGTVFALCTIPESELIPSIKQNKMKIPKIPTDTESKNCDVLDEDEAERKAEPNADDCKQPEHKRRKISVREKFKKNSDNEISIEDEHKDNDASNTKQSSLQATWDPVSMVRRILKDLENDTARDAPGSRFVSRMIPIEATCYASEEEIILTSRALLKRYLSTVTASATPKTFAIASKRRLCDKKVLSKDTIINAVAQHVMELLPHAKVDLEQPDITIVVEICKTLVGMSVIPRCYEDFRNFNLVVAREGDKS